MQDAPSGSASLRCTAHIALAGWSCNACGKELCPRCAHSIRAGYGALVVCSYCGGYCSALTVPRRFRSFPALMEDLLKFPIRNDGWIVLVVAGLLLSLVKSVWIVGLLPAFVWTGMYLFLAASRTAEGQNTLPPIADLGRARDGFSALWECLSAFTFASIPACWYILQRVHQTPLDWFAPPKSYPPAELTFWNTPLFKLAGVTFDPLLMGLAVPILMWMPAVLLLVVTNISLADIVKPTTAVRAYLSLGPLSLLLLLVPPLLLAVDVLAETLFDFHWVPFDFVVNPVAEFVKLYAALMGARIYGSVLYVRGYLVGYGRPEDYHMPALGDELPPEREAKVIEQEDVAIEPIEI